MSRTQLYNDKFNIPIDDRMSTKIEFYLKQLIDLENHFFCRRNLIYRYSFTDYPRG